MGLWDRLFQPAGRGALHALDGDGFEATRWADVVAAGHSAAAGLRRAGVEQGARVACVLDNSLGSIAAAAGTWLAGGTVVSLPDGRIRGRSADHAKQIVALAGEANARLVLVGSGELLRDVAEHGWPTSRISTFDDVRTGGRIDPSPPGDGDVAFVQFSSGTTTHPHGCALTTRAIAAQVNAIADAIGAGASDRTVSWLPLSHDMGFFGALLVPWACGMDLALSRPARFAASPRTWFDDCAAFQATLTVAPNIGLDMAVAAAARKPPKGAAPLRHCIVGAERVHSATLDAAVDALAPAGLAASTITPAYGLAEATLAVTMDARPCEARRVSVAAAPIAAFEMVPQPAGADDALSLVSAGSPLAGVDVRIDGGAVGEILVRSPGLASGYVNDDAATADRFRDGELRTGDIGFIDGGELFVVGRFDDLLTIGGRNVGAQDIERAIEEHPAVRAGGSALVVVPGADGDRLVAVMEGAGPGDPDSVSRDIARVVAANAGLGVDECVFLGGGALPRTASGKLMRHGCRAIAAGDAGDRVSLRRGTFSSRARATPTR